MGDESKVIDILTQLSSAERAQLPETFKQNYGKDLVDEFDSEFSGSLRDALIALIKPPEPGDAKPAKAYAEELFQAMDGLDTDESALIRIIVERSEIDIGAIKEAFEQKAGRDLASYIEDDCSGGLKNLLV